MNITLVQMRAFLALAESLSFTRAADSLGVTQPTLSATIRHLETAIGGRLFDRDTRKVALTALGLDCQRLARQLLSEVDRVEGQLRSHVLGRRGSVRIAAPANLFPNVLLPGLRAFRQANPGVRLEFADVPSDEAVHRLHAHQADLAIGVRAGGETGLRTQVVGQYPYVAILPDTHALAARRAIRWRDIQTEDVVVLQARDSLTSTAAALVHGGFGVGLMSYWSAHQIFKPGLVIRMLSEPSLNGTIVLRTLPSVELSPQVRQLQEALRRHAPTLPRL